MISARDRERARKVVALHDCDHPGHNTRYVSSGSWSCDGGAGVHRPVDRGTLGLFPRYTHVRVFAVLLIVVAVACGSRALAPGRPVPGTPAPVALTATGDSVGVKLRIDLDRASIIAGQELWATLTIENTNNESVFWVGGGCNVPGNVIAISPTLADNGRDWDYAFGSVKKMLVTVYENGYVRMLDEAAWQKRFSGGQICTTDVRVNELAAHATLTSRFVWDGMVAGVAAPTEVVRLQAGFELDDRVAMVGRSVGASITLPLTGGSALKVSAPRAFDAALDDARFANWIRAREFSSGNSGPAAYNVTGGARLDGDMWVITASQKAAPAGEIEVRVSAMDGTVRSVIAR